MQSALDGFRKMYIQGVSSVAVVSVVDGHLVANLSASDVRGVTSENVRDVQEPVMSFLTRHYQKPYHPVTSYASEKLYDVVLKMITAKVHRVWVVDAAYKPIGIVTISDILSKMHSFLK
jgi:CBS domain-containing protein